MTQTNIDWDKTTAIALKQTWLAVILSLFTGIGGYLYTGRYRALLISFGIIFGIGITTTAEQEDPESLYDFGAVFLLTSIVDNATAIHHNRQKLKIKQHFETSQYQNYYHTNQEALRVNLLRLIKNHEQCTVADLIIAIGVDAEIVRNQLLVLQKQNLITSENRLEDGAMIYRLV